MDRDNTTSIMSSQELAIPRKLWEHPDPKSTYMWKFKTSLEKQYGLNLSVSRVTHERNVGDNLSSSD